MTFIVRMQKAQFDLMISLKSGQLKVKKQLNLLRSTILRELNGVRDALKPVECFKTQKLSELLFSRNVPGKDILPPDQAGCRVGDAGASKLVMVLSRSWNAPAAAEPAALPAPACARVQEAVDSRHPQLQQDAISFLSEGWGSIYRHSWSRPRWEQRWSGRAERMKLGRTPAPESSTCLVCKKKALVSMASCESATPGSRINA